MCLLNVHVCFCAYIKISWHVSKPANTVPRDCYNIVQEYQHCTKELLQYSSRVQMHNWFFLTCIGTGTSPAGLALTRPFF